jgi:hypothetical protein
LLARLGCRERVEFEREIGDVKWLAAKRDRPVKKPQGRKMELSVAQAGYYARIKEWIVSSPGRDALPLLFKVGDTPVRDRQMIIKSAGDLGLDAGYSMSAKGGKQKDQIYIAWPEGEDESDEEGVDARKRVMKRYDAAIVIDEESIAASLEQDTEKLVSAEFSKRKYSYYKVFNNLTFSQKWALIVLNQNVLINSCLSTCKDCSGCFTTITKAFPRGSGFIPTITHQRSLILLDSQSISLISILELHSYHFNNSWVCCLLLVVSISLNLTGT